MNTLLALLAVGLLGISATACGGAVKDTGSASQISSTTGSVSTKPASTGTTPSNAGRARSRHQDTGGIGSIETYGHEASAADRRAITTLVTHYYAAAATDDGAKACSLIYSIIAEGIPEDYGQPPGPAALRGKTCAAVMSKLFRRIPGQPAAVLATTRVIGVRVKGRNATVLLHSKAMRVGEIHVERELGTWKIGALIGGVDQ